MVRLVASGEHPELRPVLTGLPVAGFTGSLAYRFDQAPAGRGLVRAKTGTLSGVSGLAGVATDREGTPLVFAPPEAHVVLTLTVSANSPSRAS